jgi:magnesium chelatase family protein
MDRIDLHVEVIPVPFRELATFTRSETSSLIRERVIRARKIQENRFRGNNGVHCNAQIPAKKLNSLCVIGEEGHILLKNAMERINLSARAYNRILKVSRTIADLDNSESIKTEHLAEAIQYRSLDRESWGS